MHRLSYHSHALARSPAVLDAIYAGSVTFNATAGITGALLLLEGRWAQILEGDHAVITGLYDRIARDPRHDHVTFDYLIETEGRLFPDWSMARVTDDAQADIPLARILAAVTAADSDTSVRQLRALARTAREPLRSSGLEADPGIRRGAPPRAAHSQAPSARGRAGTGLCRAGTGPAVVTCGRPWQMLTAAMTCPEERANDGSWDDMSMEFNGLENAQRKCGQ